MKLHGNYEKRLTEIRSEVARQRVEFGIADEQVAYLEQVADEASTRATVAQTPLADREHREAVEDLRRGRRQRDEIAARIAALSAEQDELLERLMAQLADR